MGASEAFRPLWPRRLGLRRSLMHDFPLKAAAVVIALLFWLGNAQNAAPRELVVSFDGRVPVERPQVPSGFVLRGALGDVGVTLRGPEGVVDRMGLADLSATLDISGIDASTEPREAKVVVTPANDAVKVVDVTPATIFVRLERLTSRTLAVQTRLANEPPRGTTAGQTSVSPKEVRVVGPESAVAQIAAVFATVRFGDVPTDLIQSTPAIPVDAAGQPIDGLEMEPGVVVVSVPLLPVATTRTVPILWTLRGAVGSGYWISRVTTDPVVVTVKGDQQILRDLERVETAPIDVSGLTATRTFRVNLVLPEGASLLEDTQASVIVTVVQLAGTRPFYVAIGVANLGSGLTAEVSPGSATVVVAGPAPALVSLPTDQVVATVDASGLGPGTHSVVVAVRVPSGTSVESVQPARVTLTIRST
ncbi:MAG TPA: CdaR family protein [Candidatus Limnocylindria bacterium]|nr:CdaR family protein [Candidatus Limnocylindria bacterium]